MAAPGNPHGWVYPPYPESEAFNPHNAGQIADISGSGVNASTNLFVSPTVGALTLTESGTYNVSVSNNYELDSVSQAYDDIFDFTLSVADSIALLNAFTVGGTSNGLNVNMPDPYTVQTNNGATCTFDVTKSARTPA
jgi:broad specificity polyphosphatase/5'/3'-nucleotidase SurE